MSGAIGKAGRARFAFRGGWKRLMPSTPRPTAAGPIGEGSLPARAGPVAGPRPSAFGPHTVVSENSDAGPPGGSPAGPAGRAARAVQQAGGGARSKSLVRRKLNGGSCARR